MTDAISYTTLRDTIEAWLDGRFGWSELPERLQLSPSQAGGMQRAASRAARREYQLVREARTRRREMIGLPIHGTADDLAAGDVKAWTEGQISWRQAAELVGTDLVGLVRRAKALGLSVTLSPDDAWRIMAPDRIRLWTAGDTSIHALEAGLRLSPDEAELFRMRVTRAAIAVHEQIVDERAARAPEQDDEQ